MVKAKEWENTHSSKITITENFLEKTVFSQVEWYRPFIPALMRQNYMDLCEFEASLVYMMSSRTARATEL